MTSLVATMSETSSSFLSVNDMELIFQAKCEDSKQKNSQKAFDRFKKQQDNRMYRKTFEMVDNGLGIFSAYAITDVLSRSPRFRILNLSGNQIGNEGAAEIAGFISKTRSLLSLNLSSNCITCDGLSAILRAIKTNRSLVQLSLGNTGGINRNQFGIEAYNELASVLASPHIVLEELDLELADISSEGARIISTGLLPTTALRILNLSHNNIRSKGAAHIFESAKNTKVVELYLASNYIADDSAPYLNDFLSVNKSIKTLDLTSNNFSWKFCSIVVDGLINSPLENFLLSKNQITGKGLNHLSLIFDKPTSLKRFVANACKVNGIQAKEFFSSLSRNKNLKSLSLSHNPLRESGIELLSQSLQNQTGLRELEVDLCEISDAGCEALMKVIGASQTISKVSIKNNLIKNGVPIVDALQKNSNIRSLSIEYNDIEYKVYQEIQRNVALHKKGWDEGKAGRLEANLKENRKANDSLDIIRKEIVDERDLIMLLKSKLLAAKKEEEEALESLRTAKRNLEEGEINIAAELSDFNSQMSAQSEELRNRKQGGEGQLYVEEQKLAREEERYRKELKTVMQFDSKIGDDKIGFAKELQSLENQLVEAQRRYQDQVLTLKTAFQIAKLPPASELPEEEEIKAPKKKAKSKKGRKKKA